MRLISNASKLCRYWGAGGASPIVPDCQDKSHLRQVKTTREASPIFRAKFCYYYYYYYTCKYIKFHEKIDGKIVFCFWRFGYATQSSWIRRLGAGVLPWWVVDVEHPDMVTTKQTAAAVPVPCLYPNFGIPGIEGSPDNISPVQKCVVKVHEDVDVLLEVSVLWVSHW